jgi:hypothetical protein
MIDDISSVIISNSNSVMGSPNMTSFLVIAWLRVIILIFSLHIGLQLQKRKTASVVLFFLIY